jgi:hypothetical protein
METRDLAGINALHRNRITIRKLYAIDANSDKVSHARYDPDDREIASAGTTFMPKTEPAERHGRGRHVALERIAPQSRCKSPEGFAAVVLHHNPLTMQEFYPGIGRHRRGRRVAATNSAAAEQMQKTLMFCSNHPGS